LSDAFVIQKERGDINIVPEMLGLRDIVGSDVKTTELVRTHTQSIEWALPAAIALFFAKPYFDELMKALGKSTGEAIVAAFKKQFSESKAKASRSHSISDIEQAIEAGDPDILKSLGRPHAPLEIRIDCTQVSTHQESYRFVFASSLRESDLPKALNELARTWESDRQQRELRTKRLAEQHHGGGVEYVSVYSPARKGWIDAEEVERIERGGGTL
jgi:hypothetical protein